MKIAPFLWILAKSSYIRNTKKNKCMKRIAIGILLSLTVMLNMTFAQEPTHQVTSDKEAVIEIRQAVERQMQAYPLSTLRDLYKNFFQDRFGPGHIIADTTSAGAYLREELATSEKLSGPLFEPTGYEGNFYRVNLSLIREGIIPYARYFDVFVRSVNGIHSTSIEEWEKEWRLISSVISNMDLRLDGYEQDCAEIDRLLAQGKYVMHHSQRFINAYDPHYRIISRKLFEEELLPLINQHETTRERLPIAN